MGWKLIFKESPNCPVFDTRWVMLQTRYKPTNKDGTVSKSINLQDSIIDDVGGHVTNDFLKDYCCIND